MSCRQPNGFPNAPSDCTPAGARWTGQTWRWSPCIFGKTRIGARCWRGACCSIHGVTPFSRSSPARATTRGPEALAEACRPLLNHASGAAGYGFISGRFDSVDWVRPDMRASLRGGYPGARGLQPGAVAAGCLRTGRCLAARTCREALSATDDFSRDRIGRSRRGDLELGALMLPKIADRQSAMTPLPLPGRPVRVTAWH